MNALQPRGRFRMFPSSRLICFVLCASATLGCAAATEGLEDGTEAVTGADGSASEAEAGALTVGGAEEDGTSTVVGGDGNESSTSIASTSAQTDGTTDADPSTEPSVTRGLGGNDATCAVINSCPGMFTEARCGTIDDLDGNTWAVPTEPSTAPACTDLYNDCTGVGDNPDWEGEIETAMVGIGGDTVTGFIHGDNYFELYVNGESICRDPIAFTPFNSNVVRFSAERPVTYAVRLVDWEEHLGVGMEYDQYNVGDGGFAAAFSDGTVTGSDWKCQVLYTSPLDDVSCAQVQGTHRDSTGCSSSPGCQGAPETCYGLHWQEPAGWAQPDFDDSDWPSATTFSEAQVAPKPAFTNYPDEFGHAAFIWGPNLVLDNEIICRITVE